MSLALGEVAAAWVLMNEAVRIIARRDGETLRFPCDIPPEAEVKLIEAARAGCVASRGIRFATGELEEIPARDLHECDSVARRCELREPGRRLPRFIGVEFSAADIAWEFPARGAARPTAPVKDGPSDFPAHKQAIVTALSSGPKPKEVVRTHVKTLIEPPETFQRKVLTGRFRPPHLLRHINPYQGMTQMDINQRPEELVPRTVVGREVHRHPRTIARWEKAKVFGFDEPVVIQGIVYHKRSRLEVAKAGAPFAQGAA